MAKDKFYQFTISGSYHNSKKEICDYEGVKVNVPYTESQEIGEMHMQSRYAMAAVRKDERFKEDRVHKMRQVFVDDVAVVEGMFSFVGRGIKDLYDEEMQDLATAKDLRGIPLPKLQSSMSLRDMRVLTYLAYSEKVLGQALKREDVERDFSKLQNHRLSADVRTETSGKVTNDEIIEKEMSTKATGNDAEDRFTLAELKKLADSKGIVYDQNSKDDGKLFKFLYGKLFS